MLDSLRRLTRPAVAWALTLALLASQTLGLAHGVAHGHDTARHDHEVHGHDGHEQTAAFSDHQEGSPVCQLFDQVGHADALLARLVQADAIAPKYRLDIATPRGLAQRHAAVYRARGPPTFLI